MIRTLRSDEAASDELVEAVRWYEERRRGLGAEFFDAVSATIGRVGEHPETGTSLSSDALTRRILVPRFPYQVVYRLRSTEIVIVAVAHMKRRPGYWRGRE